MSSQPRRPRDAAATRAAILQAARAAFTRHGYERVGVRDVAAAAGIDPALVIRYFGSKERLFAEAVTGEVTLVDLFAGDRAALGERLARYILTKGETPGAFDALLALLRSAPSDPVATLLRDAVDKQFVRPLADRLDGGDALLRASLIAAHVIGIAVARDVIRSTALAGSDCGALVALVAPVLQRYVDGETSTDGSIA